MSGIPYPDNLTPDAGNLVALTINEYWFSVLFGFAKNALNRHLWDVTDAQWRDEVEPAVLAMLGVDTVACDGLICDISFEDGVLKVKRGGEWVDVEGTEEIVTGIGAIGNGWEVEQGGEFTAVPNEAGCGNCEGFPDMPAYDGSGEARSCNIANGMVEWFMEKYQDSLDQLEATANAAVAADSVLAIFPPLYLAWDAVSDAVDEWYEAGISVARAFDTVEWREEMTERLYCLLLDNDHEFTEDVWNELKTWSYLNQELIGVYILMFTYDGANNQAHKMSYGESSGCETFNCTDCISYVSFVNPPSEEEYEIMEGTYNDGLHVSDVGVGGADDWLAKVRVRFFVPTGASVGEITYHMKAQRASGSPASRNFFQTIKGHKSGVTTTLFTHLPETGLVENVDYERTRSWSADTYEWIELEIYCGFTAGVGGELFMDDVCLK